MCVEKKAANHIIFQKMSLIKPIMQLQLVAPYKHLYTAKLRVLRSQTTTRILIPDIYFCLFSLCFGGWGVGGGSMGAIFAAMKLNSSPRGVHYKERANAHPHCSPGQEGFQGPRGTEWFGGVERRGTCEKGAEGAAGEEEGGGGATHGRKKEERYGKHLANDLKHGNNTGEINGTQMRLLKRMAKCFLSFFGGG